MDPRVPSPSPTTGGDAVVGWGDCAFDKVAGVLTTPLMGPRAIPTSQDGGHRGHRSVMLSLPRAPCHDNRFSVCYLAKNGVTWATTVAMSRPPSKAPSVGSWPASVIQAAAWRASTVTMLAAVNRIAGVLIRAAWPR